MNHLLKYLFLVISVFLLRSSTLEIPWNKVTEKDGITIYLRDYPSSSIKEFKAQAIVKAPVKKILNLLLDFKSYPKWVYNNENTVQLDNKNNKEFIYYTSIKCPKPVSDRDAIIQLKIIESSDARCFVRTTSLPKYVQEKPGLVRVIQFLGYWELTRINDNETMVVTQCHTEPGGTIPIWVINTMITTGPFSTLEKMREMVKEADSNQSRKRQK